MKKIIPILVSLIWSFSFHLIVTNGQSPRQLTADFDKAISTEFKGQEPGGVVLIAQRGKVIYKNAFGFANLELQVPMKEEKVFNIASSTEHFTAEGILQVREGEVVIAG